jgi:hypothetical protein
VLNDCVRSSARCGRSAQLQVGCEAWCEDSTRKVAFLLSVHAYMTRYGRFHP